MTHPMGALVPVALVLAACGGPPAAPTAPISHEAARAEARWGKVVFSATLEKDTYESATAKALPHPYLRLAGVPALGAEVSATYLDVYVAGKLAGNRYIFPGRDGGLYAPVAIDELEPSHIAWPKGTACWKVGTWTRPAGGLARRAEIAFALGDGVRLERHKAFAGIRWDTWIALHLARPEVVQQPSLLKATEVR